MSKIHSGKRKRCPFCNGLFHPAGFTKHIRACVARQQKQDASDEVQEAVRKKMVEEMQERADSYRPGPAVTRPIDEGAPDFKIEINKDGTLTIYRKVTHGQD